MKFAKELEQDLVPEWRAKYLNYKLGKKKIKAVARALRNISQTPRTPGRKRPGNLLSEDSDARDEPHLVNPFTSYPILNRRRTFDVNDPTGESMRNALLANNSRPETAENEEGEMQTKIMHTPPLNIPETQPLKIPGGRPGGDGLTRYGSIIGTPPKNSPDGSALNKGPPSLELPEPVMDPDDEGASRRHRPWNAGVPAKIEPGKRGGRGAYEVGETKHPQSLSARFAAKNRNMFDPRRINSTPGIPAKDPRAPRLFKRMITGLGVDSPQNNDVPLEAYRELDVKQEEYFNFLDQELEKIESFYKMKEKEANDRLQVLRDQLHEMRDRRMEEVIAAERAKNKSKSDDEGQSSPILSQNGGHANGHDKAPAWRKPIEGVQGVLTNKHHFGKNTKAMGKLGTPTGINRQEGADISDRRDFVRRPEPSTTVPYRLAKRKLKVALQEYYRGLELLKAYALLNRTAFRKINKKYDKAVNARPTGRYMSEKVNKAWFVQSEVVDGHIVAVEDLYARYFERGNHKIAVGKLRSKGLRSGDFSQNTFRNGTLLAAGLVLAIQGIIYASERLHDRDPSVRISTSYLLQLYGGYFLAVFHFLLFCIDCRVWHRAKINYVFIFEYDTRHVLDWRQLAELPCLFFFGLGLFLWLNFQLPPSNPLFYYWPVLLIGLTVLILFNPLPVLYHRARGWWAYSNFRLLLAGLYPVEFRDFFLGDMYCSQTYAMGNIEVLFCLYAREWSGPAQCNSSHSRLFGFLSTLPGIWRAFQCLRRYYDTRNIFPHLVNCGKYTFTILFYMTLSIYRIDKTTSNRAIFILFATINAIYCSVWDLAMDWSLCNPYAKHPFLRDVLGYKRAWYYYLAMLIDPILRFNWIFYVIFAHDLQHSAILSFVVSLSEIFRRGMWSLFRVENEHCTNVGRFRASRDIPLPYSLPSSTRSSLEQPLSPRTSKSQIPTVPDLRIPEQTRTHTTGTDIESAAADDVSPVTPGPTASPLRLRRTRSHAPQTPVARGIARVGSIMAAAHAQDFERKRRTSVVGEHASPHFGARNGSASSDEYEDGDDEGDVEDMEDMAALGADEQELEDMAAVGADEQELVDAERLIGRAAREGKMVTGGGSVRRTGDGS